MTTVDFSKMTEEELVAYLEAHEMSVPDQQFNTGAEITVKAGRVTSRDKKTGETRTARSSKWLADI